MSLTKKTSVGMANLPRDVKYIIRPNGKRTKVLSKEERAAKKAKAAAAKAARLAAAKEAAKARIAAAELAKSIPPVEVAKKKKESVVYTWDIHFSPSAIRAQVERERNNADLNQQVKGGCEPKLRARSALLTLKTESMDAKRAEAAAEAAEALSSDDSII